MTEIVRRSLTCEFCDMKFSYRSIFITHVEGVHLKVKRFYCLDCEKGFPTIGTLNSHVRATHLNEKRYFFTDCDSSFFGKSGLVVHIESVHEKKRLHVCPECEEKFSTKNKINRHISYVHSDIKPYVCTSCNWSFKTNSDMKRHINSKHVNLLPSGMSRGEKAISETLELECVNYVREKSFSDLKGSRGGYLRYDFAIEIGEREERYLLIEFDGKQHFYPIMFKGDRDEESAFERFNQRLRHDRVKDKYAESHGYPLLRIRYDQMKDVRDIVRYLMKDNIL